MCKRYAETSETTVKGMKPLSDWGFAPDTTQEHMLMLPIFDSIKLGLTLSQIPLEELTS